MNETTAKTCQCTGCPGSSCKCGCQQAESKTTYSCGPKCRCAGVRMRESVVT